MEKLFERIMVVINDLCVGISHPEFREWAERWEKDHASMESFQDIKIVASTMEKNYPPPVDGTEEEKMEYFVAATQERIGAMMVAAALTSKMIPGSKVPMETKFFEQMVEIAEDQMAKRHAIIQDVIDDGNASVN
jgi:hypothetical protein